MEAPFAVNDDTDATRDKKQTINPFLVSIEQAAAALGISRANLYEVVARKEIDTVRIGRRRLVRVRDLEAYVDSLTDVPTWYPTARRPSLQQPSRAAGP